MMLRVFPQGHFNLSETRAYIYFFSSTTGCPPNRLRTYLQAEVTFLLIKKALVQTMRRIEQKIRIFLFLRLDYFDFM